MNTLSDRLKGTNIYLIGMMGSGKTTIGRILANQLQYHFFDTDALIEQTAKQPITEIFATQGESAFRQLETQVLAELSAYIRLVIATGGGIVLQRQNWSYLQHGIVVWLDVPIEQLIDRLQGDTTRPLLQTEDPQIKLQTLLEQRQALYAQADIQISMTAEESPEQTADRVLEEIVKHLKPEVHSLSFSEGVSE